MRLEENTPIPNPFFGNYFCLIPNTNVSFVVISKNACTFLKKVAVYNQENIWEKDTVIHNKIGYRSEKSQYLVSFDEMKEIESELEGDLIKIAIWRDPVERIVSSYKMFCLEKEWRHYMQYLNIYNDNSFERYMQIVRFELEKGDPLFIDEHFRKQIDYYDINDVTEIVHIKDLNRFLGSKNIPFQKEKSNPTKVDFKLTDEKLIAEIKELYNEDYSIKPTWNR